MITAYSLLRERCGLSLGEAAAFHRVRHDTASSWSAGRNRVPAGAMAELRTLYQQLERAAAETVAQAEKMAAEHGWPDEIELGLATDDHEAQQLGWPCVGAHAALLGMVVARLPVPVRIVPRASTTPTAAAEQAREHRAR